MATAFWVPNPADAGGAADEWSVSRDASAALAAVYDDSGNAVWRFDGGASLNKYRYNWDQTTGWGDPPPAAHADTEVVIKARITNTAVMGRTGVGVRFTTAGTGYSVRWQPGSGSNITVRYLIMTSWSDGTATDLTLNSVGSGWFWIRFRVNADAIKVRAWVDGDAEPGTWGIEVTNSTHTSAEVLRIVGHYATATDIAWVGVGTAGDTAPSSNEQPPVLTSGTLTNVTATGATVGATTDTDSGTMYAVATGSATPPSGAQIKAGDDHTGTDADDAKSLAISTTGAKTLTFDALTTGSTRWGHIVHEDAEGYSNVVTVGPFYPGTWRPTGVSGTPEWTVHGAASAAAALSEDAPGSTAEYVEFADLTSTPKEGIVAITPMPAGERKLSITARRVGTGTVNVRVTPLDNALDPVAAPVTQLVTDSWATYEMAFTTTAEATHALVEMWDAA